MKEFLDLVVAAVSVATSLLVGMGLVGAVLVAVCAAGAGSFLAYGRRRSRSRLKQDQEG